MKKEELLKMFNGVGLYRHFKGEYYYVTGVSKASEDYSYRVNYCNVCKPELGMCTRPLHEFVGISDKYEYDFTKCDWVGVGIPISSRKDNVTGQMRRFEKVKDLNFQLGSVDTETLINELRKRTDSPIHELDIEGLHSRIYSIDYVVGRKVPQTDMHPNGVDTMNVFFNREEAEKYMRENVPYPEGKGVFKRVFIEVE